MNGSLIHNITYHDVSNNTKCHICNFAKLFVVDILTLSRVPVPFCSDTCPPSLSEARKNAGQSWQNGVPETKSKMIQNTETPCISCHNESNTFCSEMIIMEGEFLLSILWEQQSLQAIDQQPKKTEQNQIPIFSRISIKIWTKSRNCTEISSYWRIAQCKKHWMHTWIITFLVIFCNTVQISTTLKEDIQFFVSPEKLGKCR